MTDTPVVVAVSGDTAPATVVEGQAAAAVEIAQIDADRSVAVAELGAETEVALAEIRASETDGDMEWLRGELTGLRALCEMNAGGLSALEVQVLSTAAMVGEMASGLATLVATSSTPPPPLEAPPETPPALAPETALESGEGGPRESHAPAEPPPAGRRQRRKWL